MAFSINQLEPYEEFDSKTEQALSEYIDELMELFYSSPEGQAWRQENPDKGFWAAQLVNYGYTYESVTLPDMTVREVDTLLTSVFPEKISIDTADDIDAAIPELIAFWQFLKREYQLPQADSVLAYLQQVGPDFKAEMNNPENFGTAKSFVMAGRQAGFDMSTEEGIQAFQQVYNADLALQNPAIAGSGTDEFGELADGSSGQPVATISKADKAKKKKQRKIAKASRKQNRKRKK